MSKHNKKVQIRDLYIHEYYEASTESAYASAYPAGFGLSSGFISSYSYHQPRGRLVSTRENDSGYHPLPLSTLPTIIGKLTSAQKNDQVVVTTALLSSEFVISASGGRYQEDNIHTKTSTEIQGHYYTYQDYTVRPAIEELLLKQPQDFSVLLDADQSPESRAQYLQSMQLIQLTDENEQINFSDFNLAGASFKGAKLARSTLHDACTDNVDFSESDLSLTDITQAQLDSALTYKNAQLPLHLWKYWDEGIKQELIKKFDELRDYAINNIHNDTYKHMKVIELYNTYQPILTREGNISTAEKKAMLADLTSEETTKLFSKHRDLKYIAAEIVSVLALFVIGYLIAASVKKYQTGHFGLFTETTSSAMARNTKDLVLATSPSV